MSVFFLLIAVTVSAGTPPAFPVERAWEHLLAQCEMGPRNPGSAAHDSCAVWIAEQLESWDYEVERHAFSMADPYGEGRLHLVNLRARLGRPGSPFIALAAHWDTRPRADKDPDPSRRDEPILGANDGASGVAVLLALAELLSEHEPPIGVEFLFFDGEDYGLEGDRKNYLLGSRRFVRDHPGYDPELLILLDMVAASDILIPMEQMSLAKQPEELLSIFRLASELGLPAFRLKRGPALYDDHIPFQQEGIPAIDLVDPRYRQWHTHADTPSACSPSGLDQTGTLLLHYLFRK